MRWRVETCVPSDSNLLQVVGAGQQGQPLQSEMNPSRLGVFQSEPLWKQQQPCKDESTAYTALSVTENSVSYLHHQQQWTSSQFLDQVWPYNGKQKTKNKITDFDVWIKAHIIKADTFHLSVKDDR